MASLQEMMGGIGWSIFVPANVIEAQKQTQVDLEARAQRLNSNIPQTLGTAQTSGVLSNGQAKATLQQMNQAVFLAGQSQRELGEQIGKDILESAANAPKVAIEYANDKVLKPAAGAVGSTVSNIVPWQLWLIVGLGVVVAAGVFSFAKGKS